MSPGRGLSLLVLMAGALILVSTVVPAAYVLFMSFDCPGLSCPSITPFREILNDPIFLKAGGNTIRFAAAHALAQIVGGFLLAKLLLRSGARTRMLFFSLLLGPWIISEMASVVIWRWIFMAEIGPLDRLAISLGIGPLGMLTRPWSALLALLIIAFWRGWAFSTVAFLSVLITIPRRLYHAAQLEGLGRSRIFILVEFPAVKRMVFSIFIVLGIHAVSQFTLPARLTGGGPAHGTVMLSNYLLERLVVDAAPSQSAAAGSLILAVLGSLTALGILVSRMRRTAP